MSTIATKFVWEIAESMKIQPWGSVSKDDDDDIFLVLQMKDGRVELNASLDYMGRPCLGITFQETDKGCIYQLCETRYDYEIDEYAFEDEDINAKAFIEFLAKHDNSVYSMLWGNPQNKMTYAE